MHIVRKGAPPTAHLLTTSLDELLSHLRAWDQQIRTIDATVDLEPVLGSVNKGEIAELKDVRAFVLIRKPNWIRMIGLYPIVRNRAFDMVSNGIDFKVYFPTKNKFVQGKNRLEKPSPKKLENIRPQHIFDALVVRAPASAEHAVLENHTDEADASYVVHLIRQDGGRLILDRNLEFDRVALHLVRQLIFDARGDIVTDARYEDYKSEKGIVFPHRFVITRPQDEYGVTLTIQKVRLNEALDDTKFTLAPPAGVELVDLARQHPAN